MFKNRKFLFEEIRKEIFIYFKKVGYNFDKIFFVVIILFEGDNMIERFINVEWFKGLILLGVLDNVVKFKRFLDKFFCLLFYDVCKIGGIGIVFVGWVEIGVIKFGMVVCFVFIRFIIEVKFMEMYYEFMLEVYFGDNVGFNVKNVVVIILKLMKRGYFVFVLKNVFV